MSGFDLASRSKSYTQKQKLVAEYRESYKQHVYRQASGGGTTSSQNQTSEESGGNGSNSHSQEDDFSLDGAE